MTRHVSIAQAKDQLPALVRRAEEGDAVEITRYGRSVAAIVPMSVYARTKSRRKDFVASVLRLRKRFRLDDQPSDDPFANVRDRSRRRRVRMYRRTAVLGSGA